ncbi:MAG: Rrf2 family transcriptional regulator [Proteobacteria bacterium]|nr:Rrf2 family transcriptional regulator [Pseudomonadota bacterium]MBU1696028.1 Rrf2 family transcriptional regulator [Pseudomonadota bacterium]
MQISYKTDYALKVILHLSGNYPRKMDHIKDIAKKQDIPKKFLEQVLLSLKKGGFVMSKKGPNGGYFLKMPPEDISIGDIIKYMNGFISPISCIEPGNETNCEFSSFCVFKPVFCEVENAILNIIDNKNFKDLLIEEKRLKEKAVIDFQI